MHVLFVQKGFLRGFVEHSLVSGNINDYLYPLVTFKIKKKIIDSWDVKY